MGDLVGWENSVRWCDKMTACLLHQHDTESLRYIGLTRHMFVGDTKMVATVPAILLSSEHKISTYPVEVVENTPRRCET